MLRVSIIIPCYNSEKIIGCAIQSALSQDYENKEVIVVDDGSKDNSAKVAKSFDDVGVLENENNIGANISRNRGIRRSSGKYLKFLDADDYLQEGAISKQVEEMERLRGKRKIVFGDVEVESREGYEIEKGRRIGGEESQEEFVLSVGFGTPHPLHKKELIERVGGFREGIPWWQETDLHMRLAISGVKFCYREGPVATVRVHDRQDRITGSSWFQEQPHVHIRLVKDWLRLMDEEGRDNENVRKLLSRDLWSSGRRALRCDLDEVAEEYFRFAKSLHADCIPDDSILYSSFVQWLGPRLTESVAAIRRRIARSIQR
jgi:glycosyltransferase involved in cell wall biosynthesis